MGHYSDNEDTRSSMAKPGGPPPPPPLTSSPSFAGGPPEPPPPRYKNVTGDTRRTEKMLAIVIVKLFAIILCAIAVGVGVSEMKGSSAYKATEDDKDKCEEEICSSSSYCTFGQLPDPTWIKLFKWYQGLSITGLLIALFALCIYGCMYGVSGCNKAWSTDLVVQLLIGFLVGAAGVILLISILKVIGKGSKHFPQTCASRYTEDDFEMDDAEWKNKYFNNALVDRYLNDTKPSKDEIKELTNFSGVIGGVVLTLLAALLFFTSAALIFVLHPKFPPPIDEPPQRPQQMVLVQQPAPVMYQQQPVVYQAPPSQVFIQQQPSYVVQQQPVYY